MKTSILKTLDEALSIAPAWAELAPTPFQHPWWMLSWWRAFRNDNSELSIAVVKDGERLTGVAPMYRRNFWLGGSSLRFLASGNACSDFQTVLCCQEDQDQVITNLQRTLTDQSEWGLLRFDGVSQPDPCVDSLARSFSEAGYTTSVIASESTWRIDLQDGWDEFLSRMPRNQRRQERNLLNRYDKSDELQVRSVTEPSDFPDALAECIALHQKRWQASGQGGCFADQRFENFIKSACRLFASNRQTEILLLEHNGKPVASQLLFKQPGGGTYLYQCGRDPDYDSKRVGRILNMVSLRLCSERGEPWMDLMRGDEVYKSRLGALPRPCCTRQIVARKPLPRLRHAATQLGRSLKMQAQQWRPTEAGPEAQLRIAHSASQLDAQSSVASTAKSAVPSSIETRQETR